MRRSMQPVNVYSRSDQGQERTLDSAGVVTKIAEHSSMGFGMPFQSPSRTACALTLESGFFASEHH